MNTRLTAKQTPSNRSSKPIGETRVAQVSRGGRTGQQVTTTSTQNIIEEGSETIIMKRKIVTTTGGNSQINQTSTKTTTTTTNNLKSTNKPKNQAYNEVVGLITEGLGKKIRGQTSNSEGKVLRSGPNKKGEPKITTFKRGDYDNILITHIIDCTDPDVDFHIIDPLDTEFVGRAPIDLNKLRANKSLHDPKNGTSTFTSSVENWKPKPKETGINKSMVFEHSNRQHVSRDLEGSSTGGALRNAPGNDRKTTTTTSKTTTKSTYSKGGNYRKSNKE